MTQRPQRFSPETSIHDVPGSNDPQFFHRIINMRLWAPMCIGHAFHQFQEHVHDTRRVGEVRKDATAFDNKITNEVDQNSLRPRQVRDVLPAGRDDLESASIEDLLQLGW